MARIPTFVFGAPTTQPGPRPVIIPRGLVQGPAGGQQPGFWLGTGIGNLGMGWGGSSWWWQPNWNQAPAAPAGPSYANPGAVRAVANLPPPLAAPEPAGAGTEWAEARTSFNAASARVSAARQAVEELRARLEAIGQSPRVNLLTGTASAEVALKTAQDAMAVGNLEATTREIQRANYLASQVLKEFGR